MATRDLTTTYVRLRSAMHRKMVRADDLGAGANSNGLLQSAGNASIDMSPLNGSAASPAYVEMVTDINADMSAIQQKMTELRKSHDARLRISFNPSEENEKEREIEILTSEISRYFNRSGQKLKRIAGYTAQADTSEIKIRKNIQRGLATKLHDLSTDFRGMQKTYLGQMQRLKAGSSLAALLGETPNANDKDEGFTDEQLHDLATAQEDTDERMREIQRIAKSVNDLAVLFKELATLVVEQGTILDRIDYNVEAAVENTKKGVVELKEAEKYQKSARASCCIIILCVGVVLSTIIIIVS